MKIPTPCEEDEAYFRALVPIGPSVEVKPMFGNLGAFVNGNMFMALLGCDVGVKLDDADRARLLAEAGAGPFRPAGWPMADYVASPSSWRVSPGRASPWVTKALVRGGALPTRPGTVPGSSGSLAPLFAPLWGRDSTFFNSNRVLGRKDSNLRMGDPKSD